MITLADLYWALIILFGLLGMWHAIMPPMRGQEWRTATAALAVYLMLLLIGLRYFTKGCQRI